MSQDQKQTTNTSAPTQQPTAAKQKTMAATPVTSWAQINPFQQMTLEQQSIVAAESESVQAPTTISVDAISGPDIKAKPKEEEPEVSVDAVSGPDLRVKPEVDAVSGPDIKAKPKEEDPDKKLAKEIVKKGKGNYELMGLVLSKFAKTRPNVIIHALDLVGYSKEDDLALCTVKILTDSDLMVIDFSLLVDLKSRINDISVHMPGSILTSDYWQVERLRKIIRRRKKAGPTQKEETKPVAEEKEEKKEYEIGDAKKDKEYLKKTFTYSTSLVEEVGKGKTNKEEDVKKVALRLVAIGYTDIPKECKEKGDWKDELGDKIKEFQTRNKGDGYYARRTYKEKYLTPDGCVGTSNATFKALFRNSGLEPIYMNRKVVNAKIASGKTKLDGDVGKGKKNNIQDVKLVAELLVENNVPNVPKICLEKGIWDDGLEISINKFEDNFNLSKAGWINDKGSNIGVLTAKRKGGTLKLMKYNMNTGVHTPQETREEYNAKLDKIQKNLGIEDDSKYAKVISMANKAATEPEYFNKLTNGVTEKLTNTSAYMKDEEASLSPVLVDRMKRFHKFLIVAGLYSGNMNTEDGARSQKRAHRWSVEYVVESSKATTSQKQAIKDNLIKMYNNTVYREGDFVIDSDGNKWAKSEHFYTYYGANPNYATKKDYDAAVKANKDKKEKVEEKGEAKTGIFWSDVVNYITEYTTERKLLNSKAFRTDSKEAASEGYNDSNRRLPNKAGNSPSVSDHCDGGAMDISSSGFIIKTEAMIDLIGLRFGVIRDGGEGEAWHFEMTGIEVSKENEKYLKKDK